MKKTRITFLFLSLLIVLLTAAFVVKDKQHPASKQKPNIILILADDIGFETISAYGSSTYKTPSNRQHGQRWSHVSKLLCTAIVFSI